VKLLVLLTVVSAGFAFTPPTGAAIPAPPEGFFYHGVYPGDPTGGEDDIQLEALRSYEQSVGKSAAWVYFSQNWGLDRQFPQRTAQWIRAAGSVPYIRIMWRDQLVQYRANSDLTLQRLIDGAFDHDLRRWGRAAARFGTPLLVEFGTEVNGHWFPWNGVYNGAATTGPERFRKAYRHLVATLRRAGARNISFVFHVNCEDWPNEAWNRFENYFPGYDVIDWLGVSVYGAQSPRDDSWPLFRPRLDAAYPRLVALAKGRPIALVEFGVAAHNPLGDQAEWVDLALGDLLSGRWPRLVAFSWWNERWQHDDDRSHDTVMRVQENERLLQVFRRRVGENSQVLGSIAPAH
jgi:hypothetical protein